MRPERSDVPWRLETYRGRLRHSLAARFFLRYHVALIVLASIFSGWIVDVFLLKAGLHNMMGRYPVAIIASYGAFLLGVGAWLRYSGIREYLDRRRSMDELLGDDIPEAPRTSLDAIAWLGQGIPTEGCLWVLAIVFIVFALGGYTIAVAPTFFADVVLEVLLAAGLVRGMHRAISSGWVASVVANTWGSVVIALILAFIAGLLAQGTPVPHPATLHELVAFLRRA